MTDHRVVPLPPRPLAPGWHDPEPFGWVQGTLALDLQPRQEPPPVPMTGRAVEHWAWRYAQAVAEIVGGDRPASQLVRWNAADVQADLQRRALLVARAGGHQPGLGRVQPVRPRVAGVRTCALSERVVEAGIHLRYGPRSRAVAARFELRHGRWICTALEFA
ncbi:Rv3235 family protein [Nocardioides sp. SYSU D00038]|uniref:Rv3235 family protein n=1 Tax=Nocardioides sp. SYSU D00038 TaxID=2812554 RepID=UPI00196752E4|nr:Rv3235 family protein [Nocardioides sp. SYSU D00038]